MSTLAIQGMQWGDEGKGKVTDYFSSFADVVVRSQGGNNAGHSIVYGGKRYALRLLPSGVFHKEITNVIADGVTVNPIGLIEELDSLKEQGIEDIKLLISNRATLLMPYHIALDKARETALGNAKIGTTGRGIGPSYEDKASRLGLRMGDIIDKEYLKERLEEVLPLKNLELKAFGAKEYNVDELLEYLEPARKRLSSLITDTSLFLEKAIEEGKKVLFEGAQGAMLCITHGTYPYVTSSSPLATAIPLNAGLPLDSVNTICGITKAYCTRVGAGPFPSEIDNEEGDAIREKGHEYGTVTKRPRRIGWLDLAELKYVMRITGVKYSALMLLDVLSAVDEIKLCVGYKIDGKEIDSMPSTVKEVGKIEPIYISMPSWKEDISKCRHFEELPLNAQNYIKKIEEITGIYFAIVSVGPDREETIIRKELF